MPEFAADALYSDRVGRALLYAAEIHTRQLRKGKDEPYLSHVLAVTSLVIHFGGDEDQIITAALHDAVEDTGGEGRARDIERLFGPKVARMVGECSDPPSETGDEKLPWRQRKELALRRYEQEQNAPARLVEACDKLANLRDLVEDTERQGVKTLDRFSGGREGVLWYYRALFEALVYDSPVEAEFASALARLGQAAGKVP